ncbi:MAG: murein biosynthesis integral membrane protein MurJ [Christensenellaceae bacterium]|nr:murein biosynthesis integral membrane protein MurJ [Christensenellaceae bacterium]MEA5069076.1 murein biosynthesis integral membrane protein MurJ [Christensenellaceae bacterium]
MSGKKGRMFQATLAVTLVIFLSKAAGLVRDMIVAGYFSTGWEHDAYSSAYTLFYFPVLLFNSCITSTMIPLYVDARSKQGRAIADQFASNAINLFAAFSLAVGLLMLALADPLVHLVYGGFGPEQRALTAGLTQIMMPSLVFVVLSIVMASVLNANERYLAAQLTGFPLTVALIVATVVFSPRYGIRAMAWGVFAAGILQMLILVPALSGSINYRMHMNFGDERFKRMMRLAIPAMASMAVNEVNHMIDKSLASFLNTGDISAMEYAYRLITFATGVLAVPLTTVMFSKLSQHAADGDRSSLLSVLNQSAETMFMIMMPISVVGCALSTDIIRLVYQHGNFGADAVSVTSAVFLFYLVGVIGFSLRDVYNRAFHALQDTRTPLIVSIGTVVFNVALNILLSKVMGVSGLALATSIACALSAVVLVMLLRRKLGRLGMAKTMKELLKMCLAGALCLLVALLLERFVPYAPGKLTVLFRLASVTAASLLVYFGALFALKTRQLGALGQVFRRRA